MSYNVPASWTPPQDMAHMYLHVTSPVQHCCTSGSPGRRSLVCGPYQRLTQVYMVVIQCAGILDAAARHGTHVCACHFRCSTLLHLRQSWMPLSRPRSLTMLDPCLYECHTVCRRPGRRRKAWHTWMCMTPLLFNTAAPAAVLDVAHSSAVTNSS